MRPRFPDPRRRHLLRALPAVGLETALARSLALGPAGALRAGLLAGTTVTTAAVATSARAEDVYPSRPIRIVLGFPPGGSTDMSARRIADMLARQLNGSVIVENRPGATGNIAAQSVSRSPADGYTLLYGTNTTHAMNISLFAKLGYDPVKDFEPVVLQGKTSNILSVHPDFEAKSLESFIALARARPGALNVASNGNSTSTHMALELLKSMAGIEFVHVPYKGSAAALTDVMGGQIPAIMDNLPSSLPYVKSGRLRPLAVTSAARLPQVPEVPTFNELGLKGYEVTGWGALWAPAHTPRPIIERLNREMNIALKDPAIVQVMLDQGSIPQGGSTEDLREFARTETLKWGEVIRAANIRLD